MSDSRTDPQFKLRLTPELKRELDVAAAKSGRSLNAEILFRLEGSFAADRSGEFVISEEQENRIIDRTIETLIKHGWRKVEGLDNG